MKKVLAMILALAVLMTGCGGLDFEGYFAAWKSLLGGSAITPYEAMEYERPDMGRIREALDEAIQEADGEDGQAILEAVYRFYDEYDWFYTCAALANIRYSGDLTDSYWSEEYSWCMENSVQVDEALENLYYALAKSPARQQLEEDFFGLDFFDSYEGENQWDAAFTALLEEEAGLQNQYYTLSQQALEGQYGTLDYYDAYGQEMAQLLVDLIRVRQTQAEYWGYDRYDQFANDYYYYRDYTPEQAVAYLEGIGRELKSLYQKTYEENLWDMAYGASPERETMAYLRTVTENMGGKAAEAFDLLEQAGLYDISYGENKYNSSFSVYLYSYQEPFIFMNPTLSQYDKLTLAHEFGHFCCDYVSYGSYAGVDVLEIFSQGMEYLSLCYGEDTEDLTQVKMADSLSIYVEQAAFASFEQRMYGLEGEGLSVEGLCSLYEDIAEEFGFDAPGYDRREFVDITHFYTNPMYILSYVVSNDAAMQLYALELETPGAGRELWEAHLATEEVYFLEFLESAGLESPFEEGRIEKVKALFQKTLFGE